MKPELHNGESMRETDVLATVGKLLVPFIVVFGVYPQLMFDVMDPAVTALVERVGAGIP